MANSIINGTGDGSTTSFAISFTLGFLSRDDVAFWVDGEVDGLGAQLYRTITWINDGLISIAAPVTLGDTYHIARTVDKTQLAHDYADGEPIEEVNLDDSFKQTLMAVHEFLDGRLTATLQNNLDMGSHKIINLADGVDDNDAVNMGQLTDLTADVLAIGPAAAASAAAAAASATAAATSATNSASSATASASSATSASGSASTATTQASNASTSATAAASSATSAGTSATSATSSASAASTSATNAASSATAASTSATNAATSETNAASSATIAVSAGGFKYTYSTTTTASDPGAGNLRFNNATLASATAMYISETTGSSQSIGAETATWDDSTSTVKTKIRVFKQTDPSVFAIFNITGSETDNGAWDTFTVAYVTGAGSLSNSDVITIQPLRTGDKGDTGAAGTVTDADYGDIVVSGSGSIWTIDAAVVTEAKQVLADNTTNNVSSTKHGYAPKSPADATKFLNGATTNAYASVKDSDLALTDVTTNNVSTTAHGFAPKAPNDATKFLDGTGAYSVPAGASITATYMALGADVTMTTANTYYDGPSLSLTAGTYLVWAKAFVDNSGNSTVKAKLWDGTTVYDSDADSFSTTAGGSGTALDCFAKITLAGTTTIKLSCTNSVNNSGTIVFNKSGNSKDCSMLAVKIA